MKFTVLMTPVAKARARTVVKGGFVRSYTPSKTRHAEWEVRQAIPPNIFGALPKDKPLRLELVFYVPRPPSAPKKRVLPTVKPDLTNYLKLVEDAMSGLVYHDDSQITMVVMSKRYGSPPRIEIEITEDE